MNIILINYYKRKTEIEQGKTKETLKQTHVQNTYI